MAGRPSKLTKETVDKICLAIRAGNYAKIAAEMAGIGETTYYRWMEEADKEGAPKHFREFRESIRKAEADAEVAKVALISQAASAGDWKAAGWYLERKHPERWGRNDKIRQEISGPDGAPIALSVEEAKQAVLTFLMENEGEDNGEIITEADSIPAIGEETGVAEFPI